MIAGVAMPRYTAASWQRLRELADDRDDLQDTVQDYDRKAERMAREFEAKGFTIEWVLIDVDEMVKWCRREGYRVDQRGRAAYGAVLSAAAADPQGRA
jgi:hypothetical protein